MPTMPNGFTPIVASYSISEPGGVVRTDVPGGSARYALDWDRGVQRFSVTLILDALQFSVWSAFYHYSILKGAITFDMRLDSGFGPGLHPVNIMPGSYTATRSEGIMTVVAFVVETENQVYQLSAEGAAALLDIYNVQGANTQAYLDRIAQFANVDTNVLNF